MLFIFYAMRAGPAFAGTSPGFLGCPVFSVIPAADLLSLTLFLVVSVNHLAGHTQSMIPAVTADSPAIATTTTACCDSARAS